MSSLSTMLTEFKYTSDDGRTDMFEEAAERMITAEKAVVTLQADNAALRARLARLEAALEAAQRQLRGTQINWQEDCLFEADAIISAALQQEQK